MSQDVIYTKITELEPISGAGLKPNDTFMISRPTAGSNYVSYKCDYGQLSSAFVSSVVDALSVSSIDIGTMGTVQDREDLKPDGNRLVSEKVVWSISKDARSGADQDGALLKRMASTQTVEGPVMFTGGLSCGNGSIVGPNDVVNYKTLSNYVATAGIVPFFNGGAAETEGETKTVIRPASTNLKGIPHKIVDDCIAQVTLYSTQAYVDFCIFALCKVCFDFPTLQDAYDYAKERIDSGELNSENCCALYHVSLASKKPVIVNLPMAKGNILCFMPKGVYNSEQAMFVPSTSAADIISKNTLTITIKEYRALR